MFVAMKRLFLFLISYFVLIFVAQGRPIPVKIIAHDQGWTLTRDGQPYEVKGAGGHQYLDKLVAIGGNSFRIWSLDEAEAQLDEAQKRGLTVMVGLWVQHERHGFDYNDEAAVAKQLKFFTKRIKALKNHPAILCWGIGNEVDLFYSNTKVWDAVEDIAAMIKSVDPHHPTTTVTAGIDSMEIALIKEKAPSIDFLSINTYGDLAVVPEKIDRFGWDGPYMITEWGPNGHWEVEKKPWGAPIEQTSSEKAASYKKRLAIIQANNHKCIGSYVFLWGQKQETTATWYGLFDADGHASQSVNVLEASWKTGRLTNAAPTVGTLQLDQDTLSSGQRYTTSIKIKDPDQDRLRIKWQIIQESTDIKSGGDKEAAPPPVLTFLRKRDNGGVEFKAPSEPGAYRLFFWAFDRQGHVAYANTPFYVAPRTTPATVSLKKRTLKLEY